jgi:guanosine-3',5'-bis(diphosphate) 3'-pyrophosphohydrolase
MKLLLDALAFAAAKHRNQRRKDVDASPYINHPIALARVLSVEAGIRDETVIAAALLHDTIEDTETSYDELLARFGAAVASIVAEVTDDKNLAKAERKALQVAHAPHISLGAKWVKLADKTCNLRDVASSPPAGWPLRRRQAYFDWAKAVIDGLRGTHPLLEGLFDRAYAARPSSGPAEIEAPVVGVDGCQRGWLAVARAPDTGRLTASVHGAAMELLAAHGEAVAIAVDIPIGLLAKGQRLADLAAREALSGRASSVFMTPPRPVFDAGSYAEANQASQRLEGRGISAQAWAIAPKIREWDAALLADAAARRRTHEVHPELSFALMNGDKPLAAGKKSIEGALARRGLLVQYYGEAAVAGVERTYDRKAAATDDLYDALAALWSAERIARGEARSLPDPGELDAMGMVAAIRC